MNKKFNTFENDEIFECIDCVIGCLTRTYESVEDLGFMIRKSMRKRKTIP